MTRVLLYEFATSGGRYLASQSDIANSVAREGRAMLTALARDFGRIAGVEATVLLDSAQPAMDGTGCGFQSVDSAAAHWDQLGTLTKSADWTLVVAPESAGILSAIVDFIQRAGGRALNSPASVISLCSDKQATCEHLAAAGVATPQGEILAPDAAWPEHLGFPVIVKPRDGCGSQDVRRYDAIPSHAERERLAGHRVEQFMAGRAASVAVLCGIDRLVPLPAATQRLSDDGTFVYQGGELPLPDDLNERAQLIALAAIASLENPLGYLGVDLVLSNDLASHRNCVIEINPRLTTSYIGLRAALDINLAQLILDFAEGRQAHVPEVTRRVEFASDGRVW